MKKALQKQFLCNSFRVRSIVELAMSLLDYQGKGDKNIVFMNKKSGRSI